MHSSTAVVLALALAAPALSFPLTPAQSSSASAASVATPATSTDQVPSPPPHFYGHGRLNPPRFTPNRFAPAGFPNYRPNVHAREPLFVAPGTFDRPTHPYNFKAHGIMARDVPANPESGAMFGALMNIAPKIINGITSLFGGHHIRRDVEEIVARELLFARDTAAVDPESGAGIFGLIAKAAPAIISGISSLFGGNNKRDIENVVMRELFARAAEVDESGASFLTGLLKAAPTIISGISSLFGGNNQQKRELENIFMREIFTRAAVDESGAGFLDTIKKFVGSLFGRELSERELTHLVTRAAADVESGAGFFDTIKNFVGSLFGRELSERELTHLITRAVSDAESGAGFFDTIKSFVGKLFGRELSEREVQLLSRAFFDDDSVAARSLNELD